ncbi:bifunctional DNA primase/polymerase [Streptomyces sp. NPDC101151]|uniref:bifunctional DNA primase/polymerase n=1 Tax=Streptomyces sp. NPDC101151 TaxID=3366115 RepID=UPI003827EF71
MIDNVESLSLLGRIFPLASTRGDGSCSCRHRFCPRPGVHPLDDRWWASASDYPPTIKSQWRRAPNAGPAVIISQGVGVLQVPQPLYRALRKALFTIKAPAPLMATPARAWLFVKAVTPTVHRPPHCRPLPAAQHMVMLHPGSWVALPPTSIPGEGPVWWVHPPESSKLLPAALVHLLIAALMHAGERPGPRPRIPAQRSRRSEYWGG